MLSLYVLLRGLLQTTPCIGCRQLVSLFANAPRVFVLFQASEFLHVWSSGSIAQTYLRCCRPHLHSLVLIVLLLPVHHGFSPVYITELIPKYSSIKKFIKLPFQWVLIHLNRSSYEGGMAVSLQLCLLSSQDVQPLVIRPYPLVGTSDWLDSWLVGSITSWGF
jgi:hypothetical protein